MRVDAIPKGFHSITPYLTVIGADALLKFVKEAFGAEEIECSRRPDGTIGNAVVRIGNSMVMLAEAGGTWPPMPSTIYLYVEDIDGTYQRALAAGGESLMEPMDMFYGDRHGGVKDSCGNFWWIAKHIEDVPKAEMDRRAKEAFAKRSSSA